MTTGIGKTFLGIFILFLSLALFKLTGNFWGWLILFIPGSVFTAVGVFHIFRDE